VTRERGFGCGARPRRGDRRRHARRAVTGGGILWKDVPRLAREQILNRNDMSQILRGNFTPRNPVEVNTNDEDLTTRFEREALKRLGGSIAFVSKKIFLYG